MNARDTVYRELLERLTHGRYQGGEPLIPQALSGEFDFSRTPVRETLALLEQDGPLVSGRRGFEIRRRSDEEIMEIFETRAILESSAAYAAATRATPIDLARLQDLHDRSQATTDPAEVRRLFNHFHEAVRNAAHNRTINTLLRTIEAQVKVSAPWTTPGGPREFGPSYLEHAAILHAIRTGDAPAARTATLTHSAHDRDVRVSQLIVRMAEDLKSPDATAAGWH
ncbi:GntR family transcriptional regulator [Actinoplanes derwentensis]|uniref:DNA-binding transcriptional regulator, GntR family n=1 Tax=Actinoplanes derwentensis TaxID=113562 RepID=A0A1H2AJU9_9ACTN|nr:GntR family transcriptional regulator [Actinoplanes derwentensis]GID88777.1 GntR family transcriptional regulator [Actinoplanes derwentensis]SDT46107.1 DNA-binding transcriptional regulator, GntR family [Actinoplanes derwentensis]